MSAKAELIKAACRGAKMQPDELEAKLATCSDQLREALSGEIDAIQWATCMALVWNEHGVLDEVFDHLREACRGEAQVPAAV